ncbi:Uncharacterised protein [Mycobacteroides abscessus subsp. massiliense]|nr:Uncharacterised protein [Mycobacteroides abscessus subsp. massiliense]
MHDDDVRRRHRKELGQRGDLRAGGIHERARLGQIYGPAAEANRCRLGAGLLVRLEGCAVLGRQQIGDHESEIVPCLGVVRPGIAQADHEHGIVG